MTISRLTRMTPVKYIMMTAVVFLATSCFAASQPEAPKPEPQEKTWAQTVAEKTDQAAHAAADATAGAAHKAAEATDKAYQSVADTAEKTYQSAAQTTQQAADNAHKTAAAAAERVEHTVNRPVTDVEAHRPVTQTETEANRQTFTALAIIGGVILVALIAWAIYRSMPPREIPPGERTYVDRR